MKDMIFSGAATALITPFYNGAVDFDALGFIIDKQIASGIGGLVVSGTTGESATLSYEEKAAIFSYTVRRAAGKAPVIAGTGTNNTADAVRLSEAAEAAGCDALLVVTPYYNKASPDGLYEHYSRIADRTSLPVIAYNVPSRTGVNIPAEIVRRLSESGAVAAVKEASGNISYSARLAAYPDLTLYSGNDDQILPLLSLGAVGVISVLSNLLPAETHEICTAFFAGNFARSLELQLRYLPLIDLLFSEVNPIPVKYLMAKAGLCRPEYRLPLTPPAKETAARLDRAFELSLKNILL